MKKSISLGMLLLFLSSTASLNANTQNYSLEVEGKTRGECFRESLIKYIDLTNQEVDPDTAFMITYLELADCMDNATD